MTTLASDHDHAAPEVSSADDLFTHGVLHVLHETGGVARERRVQRVLDALVTAQAGRARTGARMAGRRPLARRLLGAGTALAAVVAAMVFLAVPSPTRAASIEESIHALRGPGDLRYEVRAEFFDFSRPPERRVASLEADSKPHAVIDTRYPEHLLRLTRPDGSAMVAGRDSTGEWAIRPDGSVERDNPRRAWPGWAMDEGEVLFAESVDAWLEAAADSYDLVIRPPAAVPGRDGGRLHRVGGERKTTPGPFAPRLRAAERIELWIDPETKIVERIELTWRPPPEPRRDGPVNSGPERGPRDGGWGEPAGRPTHRPGADFPQPWPGSPPGIPPGQTERNPRTRDGPTPPPFDVHRPGGEPPRVPPAAGPEGPPRSPARPTPGPRGADPGVRGGPTGVEGPRPRPLLRSLVIERVPVDSHPDNWFTPEAQTR